jgi:YHS domain-containing protein
MKTLFVALTLGTLAFTGISRADDKASVKPYELQTCLISGEKLGEMGEPVTAVYEGQELKFCCASCKKKVDADPAKYLKQYQDAVKAAAKPAGN